MANAVSAGLSERQAEFVRQILNGADPNAAAARAGYAEIDGTTYRLLHSPAVLAAIHYGVQESLTRDVPTSLKVLRKIRDDEKAPARVRADISLKLMQLAGHVIPSAKDGKPAKPISEMTQAELLEHIAANEAAIQRAEDELMQKARDITPAHVVPDSKPAGQGIDAKATDYLD